MNLITSVLDLVGIVLATRQTTGPEKMRELLAFKIRQTLRTL